MFYAVLLARAYHDVLRSRIHPQSVGEREQLFLKDAFRRLCADTKRQRRLVGQMMRQAGIAINGRSYNLTDVERLQKYYLDGEWPGLYRLVVVNERSTTPLFAGPRTNLIEVAVLQHEIPTWQREASKPFQCRETSQLAFQ